MALWVLCVPSSRALSDSLLLFLRAPIRQIQPVIRFVHLSLVITSFFFFALISFHPFLLKFDLANPESRFCFWRPCCAESSAKFHRLLYWVYWLWTWANSVLDVKPQANLLVTIDVGSDSVVTVSWCKAIYHLGLTVTPSWVQLIVPKWFSPGCSLSNLSPFESILTFRQIISFKFLGACTCQSLLCLTLPLGSRCFWRKTPSKSSVYHCRWVGWGGHSFMM